MATTSLLFCQDTEQVGRCPQGTFSLDGRHQDDLARNLQSIDGMSGRAGPDTFRCRILDHSECDERHIHYVRKYDTCRCHVSRFFCFVVNHVAVRYGDIFMQVSIPATFVLELLRTSSIQLSASHRSRTSPKIGSMPKLTNALSICSWR